MGRNIYNDPIRREPVCRHRNLGQSPKIRGSPPSDMAASDRQCHAPPQSPPKIIGGQDRRANATEGDEEEAPTGQGPIKEDLHPPSSVSVAVAKTCFQRLFSLSRFSHPHLSAALRRLERAGQGVGEPGPTSRAAAGRPPGPTPPYSTRNQ